MIKIKKIKIARFRSILDLELTIEDINDLTALCGENNVGKTNVLRALNAFFNPNMYERVNDMPIIKQATGGQSIYSKIEITFVNTETEIYTHITRDIKKYLDGMDDGLSGVTYKLHGKKRIDKSNMEFSQLIAFIGSIKFVFVESVNTILPELIEQLGNEVIDMKYKNARFSESKKELKNAYDTYVNGLDEILNHFANEISGTFSSFRDSWGVEFEVPKNSNNFRELISDNVSLKILDNGSVGIEEKGAGLQRLAAILLTFEMLIRMKSKNKSIIVCIDEPDVFMHEGLQRKLKDFIDKAPPNFQVIVTTHSKVFINPYRLKNVFLLKTKIYAQPSVRKGKTVNVTETVLVDISKEDGYVQICNHLGIELLTYEVLQSKNILVEGGADKKYITELCNFFSIECPNIIPLDGANNAEKFLEFYNSYYKNNITNSLYKPKVKLLFDNDVKGREVYKRIDPHKYPNIEVSSCLLQNHLNNANLDLERNQTNNEIEDFIYPEVICFLVNLMLEKKALKKIKQKDLCRLIKAKSFSAKGILELCENLKNKANQDTGADISFTSSGRATNDIKGSLANMFNIAGNKKMLGLLETCDKSNPELKKMLSGYMSFTS